MTWLFNWNGHSSLGQSNVPAPTSCICTVLFLSLEIAQGRTLQLLIMKPSAMSWVPRLSACHSILHTATRIIFLKHDCPRASLSEVLSLACDISPTFLSQGTKTLHQRNPQSLYFLTKHLITLHHTTVLASSSKSARPTFILIRPLVCFFHNLKFSPWCFFLAHAYYWSDLLSLAM